MNSQKKNRSLSYIVIHKMAHILLLNKIGQHKKLLFCGLLIYFHNVVIAKQASKLSNESRDDHFIYTDLLRPY